MKGGGGRRGRRIKFSKSEVHTKYLSSCMRRFGGGGAGGGGVELEEAKTEVHPKSLKR